MGVVSGFRKKRYFVGDLPRLQVLSLTGRHHRTAATAATAATFFGLSKRRGEGTRKGGRENRTAHRQYRLTASLRVSTLLVVVVVVVCGRVFFCLVVIGTSSSFSSNQPA